jgi:hypothetical protein
LDQTPKSLPQGGEPPSDFKWLLGFGIGSTGFLFATMAHGFHWL